jgi:hypothetical protein
VQQVDDRALQVLSLEYGVVLVVERVQVLGAEQPRRTRHAADRLRRVVEALADLHGLAVLVALHVTEEVVPARAVPAPAIGKHMKRHAVAGALGQELGRDAGVAHPRVVVQQQRVRRAHAEHREVDGGRLTLRALESVDAAAQRARHVLGVVGAAIVDDDGPFGRDLATQFLDRGRQHVGAIVRRDDSRDVAGVGQEASILGAAQQLDQQLDEVHRRAECNDPDQRRHRTQRVRKPRKLELEQVHAGSPTERTSAGARAWA